MPFVKYDSIFAILSLVFASLSKKPHAVFVGPEHRKTHSTRPLKKFFIIIWGLNQPNNPTPYSFRLKPCALLGKAKVFCLA